MLAEVFLSAFLQVLFDRLAPRDLMSLVFREGIRKKLEKWRQTLLAIQSVLKDAEEKQLTDVNVKNWLDSLRDLAYDLEDILDEFAIEVMQRKLKSSEHDESSTSNKVRSLVPTGFTPSAVKFNIRMKFEIEKINRRLQEITQHKDRLGLKDVGMSVKIWKRPSSTSVPYGPVIGRDEDRQKIVELILKDEAIDDASFHVISIVGMAGVGKTTLARLVYNDDAVKDFNPRAWICVSDDFDVMRVTKAVLESVTSQPCHLKELNEVQVQLANELEGKKFLLVLDDIWNENYGLWEALLPPFRAGAAGSRIIVTTRNASVGKVMGAVHSYNLEFISDKDCWAIFVQHALMNENVGRPANSGLIRERILERCRGLPLAARTLGGIFRGKELDEWEDIMNSKLWSSSDTGNDIFPVLRLSYHHLPHHLKRCFAYCSLFPKDYEFEEKQLILLWMAEGLIYQAERDKPMEDLGGEYFRDLLSRSFFQQSSSDKSRFVMHDLISDLAQWVAGISYFRLETKLEGNERSKVSSKARHLSYVGSRYDATKKFEAISEFKHLRTFLPLMPPYLGYSYLSYDIILNLLPKLQNLRVLSLSGYRIVDLPDSIGDLKHLRYLDLSRTQLRSLPKSISTLYNLQTLLLEDCSSLNTLPADFGNLFNLRHLNTSGSNLLEGMPLKLGKLTSLQSLSNFVVGKGSFSAIRELGPLLHLRGTLCISKLENVTEVREAKDSNLIGKQDLNELVMEWSGNFDESQDGKTQLEVLDMLQPNVKLKELTMKCYGGTKFPTWIGDPSFSNLVLLRFENCENCTSLPPVGQLPLLKDLLIRGMAGVKSVGREFYGENCSRPFQSLQTLRFENMPRWEKWNPPGVNEEFACLRYPKGCTASNCLRELSIEGCPTLFSFPASGFPSMLKVIRIKSCGGLKSLLPEGTLHSSNNACLEQLCIVRCDSMNSIARGQLPPTLKRLEISHCLNLKCLLDEREGSSSSVMHDEDINNNSRNTLLHYLDIKSCPSLTFLTSSGKLPATLTHLLVRDCAKLMCLSSTGELPAALQHLEIHSNSKIQSIAERVYQNTSLECIKIWNCQGLKSLPEDLHNLRTYTTSANFASFKFVGVKIFLHSQKQGCLQT
uniref:Disease resistance RPP13-like protein 1 n=1 Tax=Fagus sylvatica TaxID=28930 RepID=A0A2N9G3W5_FAGSY